MCLDVVSGEFYSFHVYTVCHSIVKDIDIGHNFIDDVMKCLKEGYGKVLDGTQIHPSFCLFVRELWICYISDVDLNLLEFEVLGTFNLCHFL